MIQVAPSILAADFAHLADDCRLVVGDATPFLHFDVMDGIFVPNLSVGVGPLASLKKAIPEALFDVHLMIVNPLQYVDAFARAGAEWITFHIEADSPLQQTISAIHQCGCKAGLSLRPATPVEALFPYLACLDHVLVMSVEPGFGGQSFLPSATGRIRALKAEAARQGTPLIVEVDGGIDTYTAPLCIAAGADVLVAGSAIFGTEDPAAALKALRGI